MVATHIKKIKHSVFCMRRVYFRDLTNTFSPVLHLNESHLSICSWCCTRCETAQSSGCCVLGVRKKLIIYWSYLTENASI